MRVKVPNQVSELMGKLSRPTPGLLARDTEMHSGQWGNFFARLFVKRIKRHTMGLGVRNPAILANSVNFFLQNRRCDVFVCTGGVV